MFVHNHFVYLYFLLSSTIDVIYMLQQALYNRSIQHAQSNDWCTVVTCVRTKINWFEVNGALVTMLFDVFVCCSHMIAWSKRRCSLHILNCFVHVNSEQTCSHIWNGPFLARRNQCRRATHRLLFVTWWQLMWDASDHWRTHSQAVDAFLRSMSQ
jgi:hypothetical protein